MTDAIEILVYNIEHSSTAKFVQMMTPDWPFSWAIQNHIILWLLIKNGIYVHLS